MKRSVYQLDVVDLPYREVAAVLCGEPSALIAPRDLIQVHAANRLTVALDAHFAAFCVSCRASVEFGPYTEIDNALQVCTQQVRWQAIEHPKWFPTWKGEFEAVPRDDGRTQLGFVGAYVPPAGAIGGLADTVVLHRVAEGALRSFFQNALNQLALRQGDRRTSR